MLKPDAKPVFIKRAQVDQALLLQQCGPTGKMDHLAVYRERNRGVANAVEVQDYECVEVSPALESIVGIQPSLTAHTAAAGDSVETSAASAAAPTRLESEASSVNGNCSKRVGVEMDGGEMDPDCEVVDVLAGDRDPLAIEEHLVDEANTEEAIPSDCVPMKTLHIVVRPDKTSSVRHNYVEDTDIADYCVEKSDVIAGEDSAVAEMANEMSGSVIEAEVSSPKETRTTGPSEVMAVSNHATEPEIVSTQPSVEAEPALSFDRTIKEEMHLHDDKVKVVSVNELCQKVCVKSESETVPSGSVLEGGTVKVKEELNNDGVQVPVTAVRSGTKIFRLIPIAPKPASCHVVNSFRGLSPSVRQPNILRMVQTSTGQQSYAVIPSQPDASTGQKAFKMIPVVSKVDSLGPVSSVGSATSHPQIVFVKSEPGNVASMTSSAVVSSSVSKNAVSVQKTGPASMLASPVSDAKPISVVHSGNDALETKWGAVPSPPNLVNRPMLPKRQPLLLPRMPRSNIVLRGPARPIILSPPVLQVHRPPTAVRARPAQQVTHINIARLQPKPKPHPVRVTATGKPIQKDKKSIDGGSDSVLVQPKIEERNMDMPVDFGSLLKCELEEPCVQVAPEPTLVVPLVNKEKAKNTPKRQQSKKNARAKPPPKPKVELTPEEKARRSEERRRRQYADWTQPVKVEKFKEYFSDSEPSEPEDLENVTDASSDFQPDVDIGMSSSSSDMEDDLTQRKNADDYCLTFDDNMETREKTHRPRPEVKGPISAFTLEILADILETPVEELDKEKWEGKIKNVFDDKIFEDTVKLTSKTRRFKCIKCKGQVKGTVADLENHLREAHDSDLVFGCFFCPLARVTEKALHFHERLHVHYNPRITCTICDSMHGWMPWFPKELLDMDLRQLHVQCHPPVEDIATYSPEAQMVGAKKCVLCKDRVEAGTKHTGQRYFTDHLYMHHIDVTAVCELCGVVMNYWKLRHRHLPACKMKHLMESEGPFQCKKCGWTAQCYSSLRTHDCTGKYDCKFCDAKFMFPTTLKRHIKNLHSDTRKHVCHICGKGFQEPLVLQDHINTHTGEKPYQCLACGTRHTSKAGLAMHLRSRHDMTTREMKEKYKNCPIPEEPNEGEKPPKDRKDENEKKEQVFNPYTGRKRGRPKFRKEDGSESEPKKKSAAKKKENDGSEEGQVKRKRAPRKTDGEPTKGRTRRTPARRKKRNTSSDSDDDDDDMPVAHLAEVVDSEEERKKKGRKKRRNTSSDSSDDEFAGEKNIGAGTSAQSARRHTSSDSDDE